MYLDLFESQFTPIHSPFISISIRLVFLERERRSGEELQGFHAKLRSKDSSVIWLSNFFSFSSLSSLQFMFCNFYFEFVVWSWILCEFEFYFSILLLILGIFEFIGWLYRFLDFNCLVRNLITFLHVLVLNDVLKGEIWNRNPRNRLSCV